MRNELERGIHSMVCLCFAFSLDWTMDSLSLALNHLTTCPGYKIQLLANRVFQVTRMLILKVSVSL